MGLRRQKCAEGIKLAAQVVMKTGREGVLVEEVERAKGYFYGATVLALEDGMEHALHATEEILYAKSPPQVIDSAQGDVATTMNISQTEINALARELLTLDNMHVTYISAADILPEATWWNAQKL